MDSIKFSRNFLWLLFIVIVAVIPPILSDAISTQILSQPGYILSIAHTVIAHTVSFFLNICI